MIASEPCPAEDEATKALCLAKLADRTAARVLCPDEIATPRFGGTLETLECAGETYDDAIHAEPCPSPNETAKLLCIIAAADRTIAETLCDTVTGGALDPARSEWGATVRCMQQTLDRLVVEGRALIAQVEALVGVPESCREANLRPTEHASVVACAQELAAYVRERASYVHEQAQRLIDALAPLTGSPPDACRNLAAAVLDGDSAIDQLLACVTAAGAQLTALADQNLCAAPSAYSSNLLAWAQQLAACAPQLAPRVDGSSLGAGLEEPVLAVQQPDTSRLPFYNKSFGTSTTGDRNKPAVAAGGGRVFVVSGERDTLRVFDAVTLAELPALPVAADQGKDGPLGIAYYRDEVYTAHSDGYVLVVDPAARIERRRLHYPRGIVTASGDPVFEGIEVTGLDVAWGEVWLTFRGTRLGGGVLAMDATTGALKSVTWQLPEYDCAANPAQITLTRSEDCTKTAAGENPGVIAACSTIYGQDWIATIAACSGAIAAHPEAPRAGWWDIATLPDLGASIAQCRFIRRGTPLTALSSTQPAPTDLIDANCGADIHQEGIDAAWGMQWVQTVNGTATQRGSTINEYAVVRNVEGTLSLDERRSWSPGYALDIAYNNRDARVDWSGDLTKTLWMRGTRCLTYVVSDADIYTIADNGRHYYEPARGFTKAELLVDGAIRATTTQPTGSLCLDTNTIPSGVHTLALKAYVAGGTKTAIATNPSFRVDHDNPSGVLDALPAYVTGTVSPRGTMTDAHSGPLDAQIQTRQAGGSWRTCGSRATPNTIDGSYSCSWATTDGSDASYEVRAELRDNVSLGGPNTGYTGSRTTIVDNTAPSIALAGTLPGAAAQGAVPDGTYGLTITAQDAGSGTRSIEVLVDGVTKALLDAPCSIGGCTRTTTFTFANDDYDEGVRAVDVVAKDELGLTRTKRLSVDVRNRPSFSEPAPAVGSDYAEEVVWDEVPLFFQQSDGGSGISHTVVDVNTATDGSSTGQWVPVTSEPVTGSGEVSAWWDASSTPDGLHRLRATTYDRAGRNRVTEWQAVIARARCPGNLRRCYAGTLVGRLDLSERFNRRLGKGVRGWLTTPNYTPESSDDAFEINTLHLSGSLRRNLETGIGHEFCPNRPGNGDDQAWYSFAQAQLPDRIVATPCYGKVPALATRKYQVHRAGDYGYVHIEAPQGDVRRRLITRGSNRYYLGRQEQITSAFGETDRMGNDVIGYFGRVQYLDVGGLGWLSNGLVRYRTRAGDFDTSPGYHSEYRNGYDEGHGIDGDADYFCVHGPKNSCTPPRYP